MSSSSEDINYDWVTPSESSVNETSGGNGNNTSRGNNSGSVPNNPQSIFPGFPLPLPQSNIQLTMPRPIMPLPIVHRPIMPLPIITQPIMPQSTMPQYPMPPKIAPAKPPTDMPAISLFSLTGKTALVTRATGITTVGGAIARSLAEAGANIILFQFPGDVSTFPEDLAGLTGRNVSTYNCDPLDVSSLRATVQKVLDDGHVIDIMYNTMNSSSESVPLLHGSDEHRNLVSQFNFDAVYVLSQCVSRHMVARRQGGKIINISTLAAHKTFHMFSVFSPMKAAIEQMTKNFALELAPYNIQVNTIVTGFVTDKAKATAAEIPTINNKIPGGRFAIRTTSEEWHCSWLVGLEIL